MRLTLTRVCAFFVFCCFALWVWKREGLSALYQQLLSSKQTTSRHASKGLGNSGKLPGHQWNWSDAFENHPVPISQMKPLPSGRPVTTIPEIQAIFPTESASRKSWRLKRLKAVKEAMVHSWRGYKSFAWKQDEVAPVSKGRKNPFGGWGATLVDSLDTLWIMGMEEEFASAVSALDEIDFSQSPQQVLNVFETTIRYLGGLLAAHDISDEKYPILLDKAIAIGDMLYLAFDTPDRMPITRWNWRDNLSGAAQNAGTMVLSAEIGSLTLEFTRLSQLTGNPKYYDAVQRIMDHLQAAQKRTVIPGLWPLAFNAYELQFHLGSTFTMGGMADSLYEYIPKEYLMLGGLAHQYQEMYENFIEAAKKHLFFRPLTPDNRHVLISGTVQASSSSAPTLNTEGQHLTCFVGGMVGMASKIFNRPQDIETAKRLVEGCIWAYESTLSGISPEIFKVVKCYDAENCPWNKEEWYSAIVREAPAVDSSVPEAKMSITERAEEIIKKTLLPQGFTQVRDTRYILRPEAIESVFILYRITGDTRYQDIAWQMFTSIDRVCKTEISYAAIHTVLEKDPSLADSSESFWMAETLKYFYLIFSEPDVISLDDYVFNTEAHPLKRPKA
ncbi:glycoside hydrolase family 47 protein [Venturia nashicola]|uniref:alpha-1,2-Mannosidase n=1 Tax=Venturia nashicola TaxID=86259 RepID=A0A4Z1NVD3_9PEZI|nr:glycoside hydrolase family 47 protein [Venturia nashicola]